MFRLAGVKENEATETLKTVAVAVSTQNANNKKERIRCSVLWFMMTRFSNDW